VADARIGTTVADYRIESFLGRGGQGMVYLAEHVHLGRKAALKLLRPELAADPEFRERFIREARLAATLDHPNVLPVYDAGEEAGELFLAQRLVQGMDLGAYLGREGRLPPGRALDLLEPIAGALDAAHRHGLVHRDVKPNNILIQFAADGEPERVYLSDFGLTKDLVSEQDLAGSGNLTKAGYFVGTPYYAAPEQIESTRVDGRTDEYSLACVLYQCLTGEVPYARPSETATLVAHVVEPPPTPSWRVPGLPSSWDTVIAGGMAKAKEDRYATCGDLIRAARQALAGAPVTAPRRTDDRVQPPPPPPPPPPPARPNRTRLGILVGGALAVVVVAVVLILSLGGGSGAPKLADDQLVVTRLAGRFDDIVVENTGGVTVRALSRNRKEDFMPAVSRDRTQVAFASQRDGSDNDIFVIGADGAGLRQLTTNSDEDIEPSFSPDGSRIAFASNRNGNVDVFVMDADGTDVVDLTHNPADDESPTWSPDGTQIAFMSNRSGNFDILTMSAADGSDQVQLTDDPGTEEAPAWSPDGTQVAFGSNRNGEFDIFVRAIGGSSDVAGPRTDQDDRFPSWSPDGTEIAFSRIAKDGSSVIVVAPAAGGTGASTQLAENERDPAWGT
jgi:serine/threonine protein kinase